MQATQKGGWRQNVGIGDWLLSGMAVHFSECWPVEIIFPRGTQNAKKRSSASIWLAKLDLHPRREALKSP